MKALNAQGIQVLRCEMDDKDVEHEGIIGRKGASVKPFQRECETLVSFCANPDTGERRVTNDQS